MTSGALGRAVSLVRVLKYICREHFEGRADQIREYTIAVEALGRRPDFDPQTDTIVRVTIHALRKRMLQIYQREGANAPSATGHSAGPVCTLLSPSGIG